MTGRFRLSDFRPGKGILTVSYRILFACLILCGVGSAVPFCRGAVEADLYRVLGEQNIPFDTNAVQDAALDGMLREVFADPGNPFDQVIIQVSDTCRYDALMKVVDVCTRQVLPDGHKLSKLSFVELPSG